MQELGEEVMIKPQSEFTKNRSRLIYVLPFDKISSPVTLGKSTYRESILSLVRYLMKFFMIFLWKKWRTMNWTLAYYMN